MPPIPTLVAAALFCGLIARAGAADFGKSFFTEDPRDGTALAGRTAVDPVKTARWYQLVASKIIHKTDVKLTLDHETQSAEYGKIDPDQGLQFDLGPGRIRFLAATVRQGLEHGSLEATFEQADARLASTSYSIVPEAPRLIGDLIGRYEKLLFHLQAKSEFEYVGKRVVGNGCNEASYLGGDPNALNYYCLGVPNKELRFAVARPFLDGRVNLGVNAMVASGWTGQMVENFATGGVYGPGTGRAGQRWTGSGESCRRGGGRADSFVRERECDLSLWLEAGAIDAAATEMRCVTPAARNLLPPPSPRSRCSGCRSAPSPIHAE